MEAEEVRRWINRYDSESLRYQYLKYLEEYCQFHDRTPEELLEIRRSQSEAVAERMLDDFVLMWEKPVTYKGKVTDSTRNMAVRSVRSFYSANYLDLARKAGSGAQYSRVKEIRVPTQDELREMCVGRNLRDIALINVLSAGGFREETLQNLTWGHALPELENWDNHTPIHIGVKARELKGKGRGRYKNLEQHAFLTPHAIRALLNYKRWRESKGEEIQVESSLFSTVRGKPKRISLREIRAIFERASARHAFTFSPHDLRRFTQTQLEAARVQPNWIRKMLGKSIKGEEAPYSRPKIEQLREAYRSALPYMTLAPKSDETRIWKSQAKQSLEMLSKLGVLPETEFLRLQERLQRSIDPDDFYSEVKPITGEFRRLQEQPYNDTHKVVDDEDEMLQMLNEGWELLRELNGEKFLMRKI